MAQIFIGADHAGFDLKSILKQHLAPLHSVTDCGTHSIEAADYPIYGQKVAESIQAQPQAKGILICGSGIGICIAANRFKHIRAATCDTIKHVETAVAHNHINILCLGSRMINQAQALDMVNVFLSCQPDHHDRHMRRVNLLG